MQTVNRKFLCTYKSRKTCWIKRSHTCLEMYVQTNVGLLCCVASSPISALASAELYHYSLACLHGMDRDNFTFTFITETNCWRFYWNNCSFVQPSARIKWTAWTRVFLHKLVKSSNSLPLMKPEAYTKQWEKFHIRRFFMSFQMWSSATGKVVPNMLKVYSSIISGIF